MSDRRDKNTQFENQNNKVNSKNWRSNGSLYNRPSLSDRYNSSKNNFQNSNPFANSQNFQNTNNPVNKENKAYTNQYRYNSTGNYYNRNVNNANPVNSNNINNSGSNRRVSYNTLDAQRQFEPARNIGASNSTSYKTNNSKKRKFNPIEKIILLVCTIVFIVSFSLIAKYVINSVNQEKDLNKIRAIKEESFNEIVSPTPEATPVPTPYKPGENTPIVTAAPMPTKPGDSVQVSNTERTISKEYASNKNFRIRDKFFNLLDVNEDIAGWLKIGNFLDQPVVKKDNSYYLTRNFLKENNPAGAIFLDESTDFKYPPENLIFHGHNMKDGSMFGKLVHYKIDEGTSFYISNPIISFDSLYEDAKYIIFSVCEIETDPKHPNYFPFIVYSKFNSDSEAAEYIKDMRSRSIFNVPIEVLPTDNLITLATCSQTSKSTRLLVVARKIRANESEKAIRDAIYATTRVKK